MRAEVYSPAMAELEALAEMVSPDDTVETLVRQGKQEAATALVSAEEAAANVRRAHSLVSSIAKDRSLSNLHSMFKRIDPR